MNNSHIRWLLRRTHRRVLVGIIGRIVAVVLTSCGGSARPRPSFAAVPATGDANEEFSIVVLPDTQCYPANGQDPNACGAPPLADSNMMRAQMSWIAANKATRKIVAVVGLGDIVNSSWQQCEWQVADSAYQILDGTDLPYLPVIGNHDYDPTDGSLPQRLTSKYNQYFGVARFAQRSWYGATTYPAGQADNSYVTFEAGTHKYLILALEFFPRDAALSWAGDVIAANPERQVIVATHAYLAPDGTRATDFWNVPPSAYGITDGNAGEAMWTNLISKYPNMIAVVNGHTGGGIGSNLYSASRVDRGSGGNQVGQMFSNYQWMSGGGSGYMRLLTIQPANHRIVVRTYSPYLDQWMTDTANSFETAFGWN